MKNHFHALDFKKNTLVELNESQMMATDSGSSPVCVAAVASSNFCGAFALGLILGMATTLA